MFDEDDYVISGEEVVEFPCICDRVPITFVCKAGSKKPKRAYSNSAGIDIFAQRDSTNRLGYKIKELYTGRAVLDSQITHIYRTILVHTGIYLADTTTENVWLQIETRSGLARKGFFVTGGIVDPDYHGEICVIMHSVEVFLEDLDCSKAIAQLVPRKHLLIPCTNFDSLERGTAGFGSSDNK